MTRPMWPGAPASPCGLGFRQTWRRFVSGVAIIKKKKLGASNTPYDGGRWVTDGGWWVTDGGWWVTDGGWCVTDGGWCVTDGGWCVTDGGWWVTDGGWWVIDGGWWVATKHQRVAALVKKKKAERPYGNPCFVLGCDLRIKRPSDHHFSLTRPNVVTPASSRWTPSCSAAGGAAKGTAGRSRPARPSNPRSPRPRRS